MSKYLRGISFEVKLYMNGVRAEGVSSHTVLSNLVLETDDIARRDAVLNRLTEFIVRWVEGNVFMPQPIARIILQFSYSS